MIPDPSPVEAAAMCPAGHTAARAPSRLLPLGIIALVAALLAGCYSFSGTTLPGHLRTIRIDPVANRTLESALADRITKGLEDGFTQRSNLRKVNEGGDAELVCVLTNYSHRPQSTSGSTVESYRVDILTSVRFVDKVKGDTLYKDDQVPGFGTYTVARGETEETGQRLAVENLVKVILDNTVSGW